MVETNRAAAATPAVAVAMAVRGATLRVRWLLAGLEGAEGLEVVVAAPSFDEETFEVVAACGFARGVPVSPGAGAGARLDAAWRAASAPVVAFASAWTRPGPPWVDAVARAADAHPGSVVEGALVPDALDGALRASPLHAVARSSPPADPPPLAGTVWPREVLEGLGGVASDAPDDEAAGLELALRARAAGVPWIAAPDLVLPASVRTVGAPATLRAARHALWAARRGDGDVRAAAAAALRWRRLARVRAR